ncbi:GNAT family N-acetyltransferase [Thermoflavimicrobium dichotomicum]|uniref:Acetyltransferase (GNAT) family protein n=1 Tax=Thermoflavimicrobium dichotomicum TaxID=46223 RepID=A0A1I3TWJ3_9BACL|nr:GNAT family N-acetyltransferase [Thermoflavimicrobium dichotomicum]SFJ75030.1 Acetyltransferase (GNAT) family protein [Thermoflavimicrobium dichotomicum]
MEVVQANKEDLDSILDLYHTVVEVLQKNGNDQWDTDYLNDELIQEDLKKGHLFGIKKGDRFVAVLVLTEEKKPEYNQVAWKITDENPLYIHRLAVHPDFQGRGLSKKLLNFAEEYARKNGYGSLRLDAYSRNPVALNLYQGFGFEERGEIRLPSRDLPFVCFEKEVE